MALLWGLLVLCLSCLQSPCSMFSPVSAMDLPSQQVLGGLEQKSPKVSPMSRAKQGPMERAISPPTSSFPKPTSEQAQQKLPPLALLKLGNQDLSGHDIQERSPGDCKSTPTAEETRRLARAMMAFTADLFSLVAQTSTSSNLVLSPLSVALALSHLALGARNQTLQSLQQALHVNTGPCLPHLLSHLCQNLGPETIRLAARIYLQKEFPIKEDFLEQSERLFGAKPVKLTGKQEEDLTNINQWVKEATEGKIEDFLSELPDNTVLLLLNAIHFHGFWRTKFDPSLTQKDSFHLNERFTVPVDMMQAQSYPLRWFLLEQPETQVAHFPFKNNMSFVVMMPTHFDWNVSQVLVNLSLDTLYHPSLREKPTNVWLPKLHLKQQLDLVATLSQLGLQELFQGPDLRGISDQSLVVSSVQHQSTMELSEAGVEAAAATSTAMNRMSISSFAVNRPFIFFIMEDTLGMPLFVGSVRNPNPGAQPQLQEQQDSPDNRVFPNEKADFHGDKTFGPDLKLAPPLEEDYPQFSTPK
ncbi:alpha-2-antiplasmin isoform X2 [Mesocricetus auratus]|nr:alpha-2-antiplasmin isoform X2 [Mesocricetus auratus]